MTIGPKLSWHDVEDLAIAALGLPEGADSATVENALAEHLEVSFEQFQAVIAAVIKFTIPAMAVLSRTTHKGFVRDGAFIVKVPADEELTR